MNYYKIYKNGIVVDVNHLFFRMQSKTGRIVKCEPKYAQLIKASIGDEYYTTEWLLPLEKEQPGVISVHAVEIDESEYKNLKEQLQTGEQILEEKLQKEIVHKQKVVPTLEPDHVVTMRLM